VVDVTRSDPLRATRPAGAPYAGSVVDAHAHLNPPAPNRQNVEADVPEAIIKARVARIVLLPAPNEARFRDRESAERRRRELQRSSNGRVLTMCGSDYLTVWMDDGAHSPFGIGSKDLTERMARLTADLKSGACAGVGEIGVLHFNSDGTQPVVRLPAGYPPLLAIAETAAKAGAWMDIHAEPREPDGTSHHDEIYSTLAEMFQRAPDLKLIYSHNGLTNARNARALLTAFPKLMMSVTHMRRKSWAHLEPITNEQGELYADWAALLEEMPERFMIGTDFLFGWTPQPTESYARVMERNRQLLGSLTPEAARRIAFENAARVFGPLE
jgi:hypothetical protein